MSKKQQIILTFEQVGERGSPMTIVGGLKAYAEGTAEITPTIGGTYAVIVKFINREEGYMICKIVRVGDPSEIPAKQPTQQVAKKAE